MKSKYYSTWIQRMAALMFVLLGSISTLLAETKLYIEDFSISAGETKKVAVCLDTDEETIYSVRMTLALPAGLQLVADGNKIKTEIASERTGALTMESSIANGNIMFSDLMRTSAINAGKGPIFYVFVKENGLADSGVINISGVELKRQDKSKVDGVVVTGPTVTKNGSASGGVSIAFDNSEVTMGAGETKTISVSMDNTGKEIQGFQATLVLPDGWTAEVTGPRGTVTYQPATGKIVNMTGFTGISGAVLNITLTSPSTFVAGSVPVQLTGIKATVNYATVNLSDITSTINATSSVAEKPTVAFAAEESVIYPGKTANIEVNMTNSGIVVDGFQADLVLPTGWTANVSGLRGTYQYNANNGRIMNSVGVPGDEGALFALSLTAPADFEGEATVQLTNVKTTINMASVKLDNITMKVLAKDADKETALAALKDEITAATTLLGEADKTVEPAKSLSDAIVAAQGEVEAAEADMMVATVEGLNTATETLKAAEQTYQDAVKAAEEKAAAKKALADEITAATTLLGEADKTVEPGKSLSDAIVAAQAVLDNVETTTEQYNEAVTTLKAAEEAYDAAVKAAEKAAAKSALTDEILAANTLLGDADQTVEPGKSLNDAIVAAKAVLTSDESTTEQLNAAIETLKAAEQTYQAAEEKAAAKKALADEITAATTLLGEADQTVEPGKSLSDAIVVAQAVLDNVETTIEQYNEAVTTLKAAEEAYDAAVKAAEKAAAKKALADEITAATTLLGEADKTVEPGKSLSDAIVAAQAVLDNAETTTEQYNEAVTTLKAAEEAYDAAVKGAEKAAAKKALADEITAATTLLGDADKTVEPGKSLSDAIVAAKAVLTSDESTTEQLNAAIETLKAAEEAFSKVVSEEEAVKAANEKLAELKAAAEALKVSEEAKAYDDETVKAAVATAEQAIADANTAVAAVEAVIAEGKLATDNKEALAAAIAAAEKAIGDANTAIAAAEKAYNDAKAASSTFAAIVETALNSVEPGQEATVTLDKDYDVTTPIVVPADKKLVIDGAGNSLTLGENTNFTVANDIIIKNVNIDATALKGNFVELAVMNEPEAWVENNVKFDAVNVKGLKKALFYSAGKNYLVKEFIVNNSVIEQAGDATTFDFTKGSAAEKFEISNSTIYALTTTSKSLYSSQSGQKVTDAGADLTQTFSLQNSTFYNLAKAKNFFSHRQSNQKWLIYDVKNNIFVDCGKSGQVIKGLNGGQNGKNPTWIVENNAFTFDGVSTAAEESTGDADEPVKNSIIEAVKFADVANADFHVEASSMVAREKTGDARWLVPYVAPTLNTNGLLLEINKATRVIELATADEAPEALKALKDELEKAEELFANPVGKVQAEIDIETKALKAAREAYTMAVVKNALDKEIAAATELLGTTPTDVDPGKALNDAIEAAKTVSAKADATAEEVLAATEALKAAEEAFHTATGIVGVKADDFTKDGAVYDLNGVRVMNPTKGLYIKNGKKYIVK